jgi:hypothetical protein
MSPRAKRVAIATTVVLLLIVLSAFFVLTTKISNSSASMTSAASSSSVSALEVSNFLLEPPQNQSSCQGTICVPNMAMLSGTIVVNYSSPVTCVDPFVNGSSEGSTCFNVISPSRTETECSGTSSQNCTVVTVANTNTLTARSIHLLMTIPDGGDGTPVIVVGKPYLVTIVTQFENGANSTASLTVTASSQ